MIKNILNKYSLHHVVTPTIAELYSMQKLGHVLSLDIVSKDMVSFIFKKIPNLNRNNTIIFTTNKIPIDNSCKKNSLILAEKIAKLLEIQLVVGEYSHIFKDVDFYKIKKTFRKTPIVINKLYIHKNYHIIVFDDSIVTGSSLQDSLDELFKITNKITFFSFVKLKPKKKLELDLNDYIFKNKSKNILSKIVMEKGYHFTTQMLRTINDLSSTELKLFMSKIGPVQKKQLIRGSKNFFNHSIPYHPL